MIKHGVEVDLGVSRELDGQTGVCRSDGLARKDGLVRFDSQFTDVQSEEALLKR